MVGRLGLVHPDLTRNSARAVLVVRVTHLVQFKQNLAESRPVRGARIIGLCGQLVKDIIHMVTLVTRRRKWEGQPESIRNQVAKH